MPRNLEVLFHPGEYSLTKTSPFVIDSHCEVLCNCDCISSSHRHIAIEERHFLLREVHVVSCSEFV